MTMGSSKKKDDKESEENFQEDFHLFYWDLLFIIFSKRTVNGIIAFGSDRETVLVEDRPLFALGLEPEGQRV